MSLDRAQDHTSGMTEAQCRDALEAVSDLNVLPVEWIEAIRLILDEGRLASDGHKDGVIEVFLKAGRPVTVRATGARPIATNKKIA